MNEFRLPDDFTDKVMDRIAIESVAISKRKENRRIIWRTTLYSLAGIGGLSIVVFSLFAFDILSLQQFYQLFGNFETHKIFTQAEIIQNGANVLSSFTLIFDSVISSIKGVFQTLTAYPITISILFSIVVLTILSKFLFGGSKQTR